MAKKSEKVAKKNTHAKGSEPVQAAKPIVAEKFFEGIGRRKEAVARTRISASLSDSEKMQNIVINGKNFREYFPAGELQISAAAPLNALGIEKKLNVTVRVAGGGIRGQAEAVRLGIARALVKFSGDNRKILRDLGYLTRDDRVVERKKAGLKKARRAPQWQKR